MCYYASPARLISIIWLTFKDSRVEEGLHVRCSISWSKQDVLHGHLRIVWKHRDYRGLKKRITAIRTWQEGLEPLPQWSVDPKVSSSEVRHKPSRVSWSVDDRYGLKTSHRRRLSMPTLARSRPNSHQQSVPLYSILLTLPPIHIEFFTYLDRQLAKIDSFYSEREKEAQTRNKALEIQLRELKDHRKIFYVSKSIFQLQVRNIHSD